MQEAAQPQMVLQPQQSHQIQQQSQHMQQSNQHIQQQTQQMQQHQIQQQSQQMQQPQSMQQQSQLQQQSQQIQQQISADVALSAPLGTMSVQVAPQSTMTAMPAGSMAIQLPQSVSSISQSGLQQQSGTTTITTMSALQQQQPLGTDWTQSRVQVIQQQPLQNATYLQQLYNPQSQLLVPGNLALHSAGVNPGSIQVIAAGKPFQQAGPHILTQGKQVITAQSQAASFPGYTTIPTTNNQTLVIGQLGMITSQPSILSAQTANGQSKQDLQKFAVTSNRTGVQSNQAMQFSPWQFGTTSLPQNIWTTSPQQPALLATQNSIFIRGASPQDTSHPQQQAQHMFIHSPPPQQLQHHSQAAVSNLSSISQHDGTVTTSIAGMVNKPRGPENIQPKANVVASSGRPALLPNSSLRPASSVSTQTAGINHVSQSMQQKSQPKIRAKSVVGRGVGIKMDATSPNKPGVQPLTANKMMLQGTPISGAQTKTMQQQQIQMQQVQPQQIPSPSQQAVHQQMNVQQQQQIAQSRPSQVMGVSVAPVQQQTFAAPQQIQAVAPTQQQTASDGPVMPVLSMEPLQSQTCVPSSSPQMSVSPLVIPPQPQTPCSTPIPTPPMQGTPDSFTSGLPGVKVEALAAARMNVNSNQETADRGTDGSLLINGDLKPNAPSSVNINGVSETVFNRDGPTALEDTKERSALPKALVKPQLTNVLTHVIEGFVIQEASEPFPVNNSLLFTDQILDGSPEKRMKLDLDDYDLVKRPDQIGPKNDYATCEYCGKCDLKSRFKKSKRFCSVQCSKRFSYSCGKRTDTSEKGEGDGKSTGSETEWDKQLDKTISDLGSSGPESSLSPSRIFESVQPMDSDNSSVLDSSEVPKANPLKWTVTEVYNFIKALPGCCDYAEDFANQEIDGQALMLLKPDHLMSAMSMKLGPALKIVSKIDMMREAKTDQQKSSSEK